MPLWIGPELKFLQCAWGTQTDVLDNANTHLQFALKVNGCLAELGWGGWKLVGLPLTLKMGMVPTVLEAEPRGVLGLLAALRRGKKLNVGDADLVWRTKLEKWSIARLEIWEIDNVKEDAGEKVSLFILAACMRRSADMF
jgi:U3 small nucleolar RNA-associated protein 20